MVEENKNENEQLIIDFQNWLFDNGWVFDEKFNKFVNESKGELKTGLELTDIYNKEEKAILEKEENAKKVKEAFEKFLLDGKWNEVRKDIYTNADGVVRNINELVDDFKIAIARSKEVKTEIVIEKTSDVKEISEQEGIEKLKNHKYKGSIKKHYNAQGILIKTVKLLDSYDNLQEEFWFKAK